MTGKVDVRDERKVGKDHLGASFLYGSYYSKIQEGSNSPEDLTDNRYVMSLGVFYDPEVSVKYGYPNNMRGPFTGSMISRGYGLTIPSEAKFDTNDEYKLLAKLTGSLRDHQFNAAVFGAEARSSLEMVAESATRIASAFRYLKRGDITRAARAVGAKRPGKVYKDIGNNWLELQYGWIPLLGDAYEAGKAIGSLLNRPQRTSIKSRRKKRLSIDPTLAGNTGECTVTKQVIARLEEEYSPLASLGLINPEIVAWELIPYSFVADWFLPIGDFLEYRAVLGNTKATFVVTTVTKAWCQGGTGTEGSDGYVESVTGGDLYRHNYVDMKREIRSSYDVPLPSFQNPLDLSWKRCVSAIALLGQRVR